MANVSATRRERLFHPWPAGESASRSLLLVTGIMVAFGTLMVASASEGQASLSGGSPWTISIHDVAYVAVGILALVAGARISLDVVIRLAPSIMTVTLVLLAAVKVAGVSVNGGKRWLNLHVLYLQPSEIFKLATIVFVAWLASTRPEAMALPSLLARAMVPVVVGVGLIVWEPDLGTASVVVAIALVLLAVAGLAWRYLARIAAVGVLGFFAMLIIKPYAFQRMFSFLHSSQNLQGAGYQLLQSKIGLGAGGLTGLGFGHSREKWGLLPNPHTDFIFAILGEELGLIGTLVVIVLFVWFLMSAIRIAQRASSPAYHLLAVGIGVWIVLEAVINIASVVGLWAVTGVPLPFFSYGGTALITELAAVGLLYNVGHDNGRHSVGARSLP